MQRAKPVNLLGSLTEQEAGIDGERTLSVAEKAEGCGNVKRVRKRKKRYFKPV